MEIPIISFIVTLVFVAVFNRSLHMFQLNSYRADTHFKWLSKNYPGIFFPRPRKAKKPLVYTHRVIRMMVTALIIYLAAGVLLVMWNCWVMLALPLVAPFFPIAANAVNTPIEKANNNRYIKDAKRIINSMPNLVTIAVTGSYGKTSTKFYLQKLLSVKYNVLMTPESYNTTLGVVKTVRTQLRPTHEIFICEMGMKWQGDIKEICDIVNPKHAMLTSIGPQHLESMKTIENIIEEKFSVTHGIDTENGGMIFLNFDNEYIKDYNLNKPQSGNIISYGTQVGNDYVSKDISVSENGTAFTVDGAMFETRLLGSHNVQNITGAIAVALRLGITANELLLPVKRLEPAPHRLQIRIGGNTVFIDDAFNSNPVGAKAALDVLKAFSGTRILITPGMIELGSQQYQLNKTFGEQAADSCDYAVLIGEKQSAPVKDGLSAKGFDDDRVSVFNTFDEGLEFACGIKVGEQEKRIILIENDLPDNY